LGIEEKFYFTTIPNTRDQRVSHRAQSEGLINKGFVSFATNLEHFAVKKNFHRRKQVVRSEQILINITNSSAPMGGQTKDFVLT